MPQVGLPSDPGLMVLSLQDIFAKISQDTTGAQAPVWNRSQPSLHRV